MKGTLMMHKTSFAQKATELMTVGSFTFSYCFHHGWLFGRLFKYQIQHCFKCIFDLFLKTVFNLFCEIGFKYGEKCILNVFFDCF